MKFLIPTNLAQLTVAAINALRTEAAAERAELLTFATANQDSLVDETLDDIEALQAFDAEAQAELDARAGRAARLAAAAAPAAEPVVESVPAPEPVADPAPVTAAVEPPVSEPVIIPSLADIAHGSANDPGNATAPVYASLVAAADVPGYSTSQVLDDIDQVAQAFMARTAGYAAFARTPNAQGSHGVALLRRDYPDELRIMGNDGDQAILEAVANESRLPGGSLLASNAIKPGQSLTAATGWCAPSTTIYDTCLQITTDGLADFPEVTAPRGGIRHNTGIEFDTIFGDGTGYFNLTEAQVISGTTKTCLEIPCPSFTDDRLGVTGLCLTGNILQNRGYPEFVATFIRGALAASAHQINMLQIAAVVTGSTAVDLTAAAPWTGDGTVVSQIMSAVEMAITDMKYRLRLSRSATLEVKMPFWVLAQMRADWIRRNAVDNPSLVDSDINSWFATRGATVDFVYDWQDAFSSAGVGPGADTPITALPTQLVFLVYPSGTWVRAVSDVITLNAVYDSTKLVVNQLTQLFTETGWKMIKMCPVSRAYTVNLCPSGETGAQRTSSNTIAC
jgi:hypothetical protein